MSRNRNTTPLVVIAAIIVGVVVVSFYFQSHKFSQNQATSPAPTSSPVAIPQAVELSTAKCHMNGVLPDPTCTPGVIDPAVTQDNISSTICIRGYTKTVRPSASYTNKIKSEQMTDYSFTYSIRLHEEDHLISLELGGAPSDPGNLWPELDPSPNPKDKVENFLHAVICAGRISLMDAQHRIAIDWITADQGLVQ